MEQILARHHDLPALDRTLTTTGNLGGRVSDEPVTDLNKRRFAFATWSDRLHAVHRSEHRMKGYLDLRARTDADAPSRSFSEPTSTTASPEPSRPGTPPSPQCSQAFGCVQRRLP